MAISFTNTEFKKFNGTRLDELQLVFTHDDCCGSPPSVGFPAFEKDIILVDIDLEIEQKVWAFFATLGLTERWDVGAVLPIVQVRAEATANATIINQFIPDFHQFGPGALDEVTSSTGGEDTGIGDVIVRSKYNFLRDRPSWPDLSVVGQVTLPTGDENNLQGTGEAAFQGLVVASQQFGRWTPHLNLGYEISTDHERDNLRYVAGFDVKVHDRVTTAFDVIGRWEPRGDDIGDHLVDAAFGVKFIPFLDIPFNGSIIVPINDNSGLRPDFTWTVGAEYTF